MARFEPNFFEYFNNLARQLKAQPLNLGGQTSYSGGAGGPPGGFIGWLPQSRVAYDLSEEATLYTPVSGANLVDNLNHIRYRLGQLEETIIASGVSILDEGVLIADEITELNFTGNVVVTHPSTNRVDIDITWSGSSFPKYVLSGVFGVPVV